MKRIKLAPFTFILLCMISHVTGSILYAQIPGKTPLNLELTYPVGESPRVFTHGWVFGAKAVINPGAMNEKDISEQIKWSGSGTFVPDTGHLSRPVFPQAGKNTITLTVTVEGEQTQKSYTLDTVDPFTGKENGLRLYAVVGDLVRCPPHGHGCPSCPHPAQGPIVNGSPSVMLSYSRDDPSRSLPVARIGDTGVAAACCGPNTFEIVEGDPNVLINGKPAARIGDKTLHCKVATGTIIGYPEKKYYLIFQPYMPQLKEEKKLKRGEDESEEQWVLRKKTAYQNLTYNDFVFADTPLEETPFIMAVSGEALQTYPDKKFTPGSHWTMKLNISSKIEGLVLLTCRGAYNTKENLIAAYPFLQKEKQDSKEFAFTNSEGTGTIQMEKETITVGPLTPDWTEQDKQLSVQFMKSLLTLFDCFVTHVTYGVGDTKKINIFRTFRDEVLQNTPAGAHLIRLYDEHGLALALQLKQHPLYLAAVRYGLDRLAGLIDCLDTDNTFTLKAVNRFVYLTDIVLRVFVKEDTGSNEQRCTQLIKTLILT